MKPPFLPSLWLVRFKISIQSWLKEFGSGFFFLSPAADFTSSIKQLTGCRLLTPQTHGRFTNIIKWAAVAVWMLHCVTEVKWVMFCHPANIAHTLVNTLTQQSRNIFYLQSIFCRKSCSWGEKAWKVPGKPGVPQALKSLKVYLCECPTYTTFHIHTFPFILF